MNYLFKFITASLVVVISIISVSWAMAKGLDANEIVECTQWNSQSKNYQGYYLTQWQDEQCRHHGIVIDAPVEQEKTNGLARK